MSGNTLVAGHIQPDGELTPNSMSAAIDNALAVLLPLGVTEDARYRRSLAVAIAVGVIQHLQYAQGAFVVDVRDKGPNPKARIPSISVDLT